MKTLQRAFWFVMGAVGVIGPAGADIQQQMDEMLNQMSNYTAPAVYETQRRGVISGGGYSARTRIINESLLSATAPSVEAGCGGIDLYGGSFSYVNLDRIVQLFRSIASNAQGYAFKLALSTMCPDCDKVVETLQKKIQLLNQFSMSSCEMAQGIVTDAVSALQGKLNKENSLIAQSFGNYGDTFESLWDWGSRSESPSSAAVSTAPEQTRERIIRNLVWQALTDNNVSDWYTFSGAAGAEMLEAMMSVTGTLIVNEPGNAPDGQGTSNPVVRLPSLLSLRDIILGGEVQMYVCDNDDCLNPQKVTREIDGFRTLIRNILLGDGTSQGLLYKMARPRATGDLTNPERGFLLALPRATGTLLRRLVVTSYGAAVQFTEESLDVIALEMASELLDDMARATAFALQTEDHAYGKEVLEMIRDARTQLAEEYRKLDSKEDIKTKYRVWLAEAKKRNYLAGGSQKNTDGGTDAE